MKKYTISTYSANGTSTIWPLLAVVTFLGLVLTMTTPAPANGATKSESTKTFLSKVEKLEAAKKAKAAKKEKKVAPGTLLTIGDNGKLTFHTSKEKVARHLLLKIQSLEKRNNFLELQVDDLINRLVLEKLKAAQKR